MSNSIKECTPDMCFKLDTLKRENRELISKLKDAEFSTRTIKSENITIREDIEPLFKIYKLMYPSANKNAKLVSTVVNAIYKHFAKSLKIKAKIRAIKEKNKENLNNCEKSL